MHHVSKLIGPAKHKTAPNLRLQSPAMLLSIRAIPSRQMALDAKKSASLRKTRGIGSATLWSSTSPTCFSPSSLAFWLGKRADSFVKPPPSGLPLTNKPETWKLRSSKLGARLTPQISTPRLCTRGRGAFTPDSGPAGRQSSRPGRAKPGRSPVVRRPIEERYGLQSSHFYLSWLV
jgi:hypothetical protein